MRYLEAIAFALVFGIGNVVNLIWKKHMNKVFWTMLSCLWIYNFYQWYQDPSGTWEIVKTNLQNPWYWIPLVILLSLPIFGLVLLIKNRKTTKSQLEFLKEMRKSLLKSAEETGLMNSDKIPSDEDITKYYKMYLVKFELDNRDQWNTAEPMSFEHWEKCAKNDFEEEQFGRVKWAFMMSMTSDTFMFDPSSGQSTMFRHYSYEDMIERDEYKDLINRQLDIE